jgi:inosine-uridine nucleoside N-ribohydrolase
MVPTLEPGRTPVFISTDMSGDDIVAVLYLLSHPEVQVLGIGSSEGVAHVENGARNALQLLALVGQEDVPVAVGKEGPLEGENAFPSSWRSGYSRPLSSPFPQASTELVEESTAELLAMVVDAYPGQVTVVILGAHTDVALALHNDPSVAERIKGIVIMGGAVFVPGNIHKEYPAIANETAEWNLWVDPVATAEVFGAGIPMQMVPLDATDLVRVDRERYEAFASAAESAAAQAVESMWRRRASGSGFFIWDVVAAVALTLPDAAQWQFLPIEVVTGDPDNLGQTRVNEARAPNVQVSVSVDAQAILDEIARVLNSPAP